MPETKADLQAENERLRAQLAAGGSGLTRVTFPARPAFRGDTELSEGERQDLEINGVTNSPFDGRRLLASDFGIEPTTDWGRENLRREQERRERERGEGIEGVDYIYPSIRPGVLAPEAQTRGAVVETAVPDDTAGE